MSGGELAVLLDPRLMLEWVAVEDGSTADAAEAFGGADIAGPSGEPTGSLRSLASVGVSGAYKGLCLLPLNMHVYEGEGGSLVVRFKYAPHGFPWNDPARALPYPMPHEALPSCGVFPSVNELLDFAADITRPRSQMLAVYQHRADDGSIDFSKIDLIGCDDWRQAADEFCGGCEPLDHRECNHRSDFKGIGLAEQAQAIASPESVKYLALTASR